eukprot:gb/GEZN01012150.1/.p1 GENE.gb/GEZN01012150.1/~~gb/GEZN01012150.1/.p1  ORF type:complete len:242 (-),score=19.15 gb/GEZN01012150.1/:346-1071(-)
MLSGVSLRYITLAMAIGVMIVVPIVRNICSAQGGPARVLTISSSRDKLVLRSLSARLGKGKGADKQALLQRLKATIRQIGTGAGLAAPQIGVLQQGFVFSAARDLDAMEFVVNPSFHPLGETTSDSSDSLVETASHILPHKTLGWEGCFSLPLSMHYVKRYNAIQATFEDFRGNVVTRDMQGFEARVFQHEYDHLHGKLCCDAPDAIKSLTFESQAEFNEFIAIIRAENAAEVRSKLKKKE